MAATFLRALRNRMTGGLPTFELFNAGIGYNNGGAVTQITTKATGVTLNAWCGQITMNNAALNATTSVNFTLTNNRIITGNEEITLWIVSGATAASYSLQIDAVVAGSCSIRVENFTAGPLSEAIVIGFAIRPAAIA